MTRFFLPPLATLLALAAPSPAQAPKGEADAVALTLKDRTAAKNKLKQIALACFNYESANGVYPPAATVDKAGKPLLSWRVAVLPYLEETPLYQKFKLDEPWDSEHNKKVLADNPMPKSLAVVAAPKAGAEKLTHFQLFTGPGTAFPRPDSKPKIVETYTDGTSNTILVGVAKKGVPWTKPDDMPFDPKGDPRKLLLETKLGYLTVFADGSQVTLKPEVTAETLKALVTPAGGEVVERKEYTEGR